MKDEQVMLALSALQPRHTTEYVTRDVHEHRAPTDASVKLLKEMEQAARDKVLETVRLEDNGFEAVCHRLEDFASDDVIWRCAFKANGQRLQAEVRVRRDADPMDAAEKLRDEVAKRIAGAILAEPFAAVWRAR